jgi:hypothetical protein
VKEIFKFKRAEVTKGRRKVHDKELHNYSSSTIIGVIDSRIVWSEY